MKITTHILVPVAVLALGVFTTQATSSPPRQNAQGGTPRQDMDSDLQADTLIGMLGMAGSLTNGSDDYGVETVVSIYNDTTSDRRVRVEWLYDLGGPNNLAGVSGPLTIGPGESWEFSTANAGETNWPLFNNSPRDTTQDFVGRARIYSDPGGFRGIAMQAFRLTGKGLETGGAAAELTELNVYKIRAASGFARQAGD